MATHLADARYAPLHEGDRPIPGFHLVRRRGRGGFGEVWEAEAPGGFLVALKFVRLASRAQTAELRALEFVRGIHHPNLLSNFGSWQVDDTLIIGMELADRSLWDRHVEATRQGLEYRHTLDGRTGIGVQHRDLKPSNILLFGGGAKVADLGLARAMEGETAGHTGIWTFSYAAPEFFRGETTRQSDQYSLAATYCQLRGGRLPFEGGAASVTAGHLFGQPDLDGLPEPERPIVERALAKVPGDRWPDCRAFVDALRAVFHDSVSDSLIDPDGPSEIPREFRSSTGATFNFATGFDAMESGTSASGWRQVGPKSGPAPDPSRPPSADEAPPPTDFDPTLILPSDPPALGRDREPAAEPTAAAAIGPEPGGEVLPGPSRRRAPSGLQLAATMMSAVAVIAAVVLAASDVPTPAHPRNPAGPGLRPSAPDMVIADGIGSAAASDLGPSDPSTSVPTPRPVPSIEAAAAPGPAEGESRTTPTAPPVTDAPAPTPALPPGPAPPDRPRPALALEGPLEMDIVDPKAGGSTPPPATSEPGRIATPPIPGRNPPGATASFRPSASPPPTAEPTPVPAANINRASPRPRPAEAAFARGEGFLLQESFARAVAEFDEAIRLDPGLVASYLPRAVARHRAGDPRAALADYAAAIRARPDDVTAYISRGQAYHELGAYDRAIADYDEAIRRRPADADALLRRGLARYRSGDLAGSVGDFTATLRLDPKDARAAEFRADALARLGPRDARSPIPGAGPGRPSTTLTPFPTAAPAATTPADRDRSPSNNGGAAPPAIAQGGAQGPAAIRETTQMAPQPRKAGPGARPGPNQGPPDRRRPPGRRLLPWPFPKSR